MPLVGMNVPREKYSLADSSGSSATRQDTSDSTVQEIRKAVNTNMPRCERAK